MPLACILLTRVRVVSNPSTSYMRTSSNAAGLGGPLNCHCQETLRPGCQQPGHGTGAARPARATTRARAEAPEAAGAHADRSRTTQSRDRDASRCFTEQVSAAAPAGLDLTARR